MGDDILDLEEDFLAMDDCPAETYDEDLLAWDETATTPYPVSNDDIDAIDPNTLVKEMVRLRKQGKDPLNTSSVVERFNRKASEEFDYWLERYNKSPDYVNRMLACSAINHMRVNAFHMEVESADGVTLVTGNVVGATPDGKKVKLLFVIDPHLIAKYGNCKFLPRMGAYWFDVKTRKASDRQIPFCLAPGN